VSRELLSQWRVFLLWSLLLVALLALIFRLFFLQFSDDEKGHLFLKQQGDLRVLRNELIPAGRGEIIDRNGALLAYSTPVQSIWINPKVFENKASDIRALSGFLDMSASKIKARLQSSGRYVFLRRQIDPALAERVLALKIKGVHAETEYKRYYPAAEFASHIVGFTDVEDRGQEGIELAFDDLLSGQPGERQVMRNGNGEPIKDISMKRAATGGGQLQLSIDMNLQYMAYRELKAAVADNDARSGSMVVLDVASGEVLALVNQPSYNVNDRSQLVPANTRNRALIDLFEPGSTVKPFTLAAALEEGSINASTIIDTSPGMIRLPGKVIKDPKDYGKLDVASVLSKSSQVGTTKISLGMEAEQLHGMFSRVGFGEYCATGFPGEQVGLLPHKKDWSDLDRASLSYGLGMSVNAMQLARAYSVIAADGIKRPVSLLKHDKSMARISDSAAEQVMSPVIARQLRDMMVGVVDSGTGTKAQLAGYSIAGKTGTAHRVGSSGYEENNYRATFAGMVPASDPKLVVVVTIDDPKRGEYHGGKVAAPIFSRVVRSAVRLLNIAPDRPEQLDVRFASEAPAFAPLGGLNFSKSLPAHRGSLRVGHDA